MMETELYFSFKNPPDSTLKDSYLISQRY